MRATSKGPFSNCFKVTGRGRYDVGRGGAHTVVRHSRAPARYVHATNRSPTASSTRNERKKRRTGGKARGFHRLATLSGECRARPRGSWPVHLFTLHSANEPANYLTPVCICSTAIIRLFSFLHPEFIK